MVRLRALPAGSVQAGPRFAAAPGRVCDVCRSCLVTCQVRVANVANDGLSAVTGTACHLLAGRAVSVRRGSAMSVLDTPWDSEEGSLGVGAGVADCAGPGYFVHEGPASAVDG